VTLPFPPATPALAALSLPPPAPVLAAVAAGLLVYGLCRPLVPPRTVRRPPGRTGPLPGPVPLLLLSTGSGLTGAVLAYPLRSDLLMLLFFVLCGLAPYRVLQTIAAGRHRRISAAVGPALAQVSQLAAVRGHPLLAFADALPILPPALRGEFETALAEAQAGEPLPEALRRLAARCGDNFYLHQLAELISVSIRDGAPLSPSLARLVARQRVTEELKAEEAVELFGYRWLTGLLLAVSLAPLFWWAWRGSPAFAAFLAEPLGRWLLHWVVFSGFGIASLPYWLAIEEG
jgi:Flp pilus assembly protein TadB